MICNGCGGLPSMAGITAGAPYHTWWCMKCFNQGRHRDPTYHGHLTRNENYSVARAMGLPETYSPTTTYNQPLGAQHYVQVPPSTLNGNQPRQPPPATYGYQQSHYQPARHSPGADSGYQNFGAQRNNQYRQPPHTAPSPQLRTPTHTVPSPPPRTPTNEGTPRIEDYSVGWICAIDTEYVAACELLEKEYPSPEGIPDLDDNYYTCGRIGSHNVVMACLPRGRYGLTSATGVANNMRRTFAHLRIRLMVGIGGGAPTKENDIRLGDVVVSIPCGRTGGVIHYEFGKTIQNKQFERTGQLDAPPKLLLNAVNALDTTHQRRGHSIQQTIQSMLTKNPRLRSRYTRPDQDTDVLHASTYVCEAEDLKCVGTCATMAWDIVWRKARGDLEDDPKIHYGLIASADRLMKDAAIRNHLAETEDVKCFEMEAAGLMGDFPCLVIRGICDYSDTHKNDVWQGYAAATAAAYAKELLMSIPPALPARRP